MRQKANGSLYLLTKFFSLHWSFTVIISTVAWVNSRHFVRRNQCRETSAKIPYWWHVTTQIWVVPLIGWSEFSTCTTNQRHYTYLDLGGDASSVCARFADVISRGNQKWSCEMSAVFTVYFCTKKTVACHLTVAFIYENCLRPFLSSHYLILIF